jgi:hypothetical protein
MNTAKWISAGIVALFTGLASADDGLVPVPQATNSDACDPCVTACDPCCPPKPAKFKTVCGPRPKVIVHQSEPIVEFCNDAPSKAPCVAAPSRPVITDRAVKPCGGELFGHGCGCGHGFFKKHHQCAQGPAPVQMSQQTVMTAVPLTVQAYVPQTITTMTVVPTVQTFAAQALVAPPVGVGAGYTGLNVASSASDLAMVNRAVEILSGMNGPAPAARVTTGANAPGNAMAIQAAAAAADKAANLEKRMDEIDARLLSVERRLKALCVTQ